MRAAGPERPSRYSGSLWMSQERFNTWGKKNKQKKNIYNMWVAYRCLWLAVWLNARSAGGLAGWRHSKSALLPWRWSPASSQQCCPTQEGHRLKAERKQDSYTFPSRKCTISCILVSCTESKVETEPRMKQNRTRQSRNNSHPALEGTAASRHAGPSPGPGPPESQMVPGAGAKTSGTALSGRKRNK